MIYALSEREPEQAFSILGSGKYKEVRIRLTVDSLEDIRKWGEERTMNFEELRELVLDWADDKDLLYPKNSEKQFMKFIEEVFEFKTEMDKNLDGQVTIDSKVKQAFFRGEIGLDDLLQKQKMDMGLEMGDIFVTLIILCKQLGINPIDCLNMAYKKISKRKGKTIDGVFVKEEDL
nr:MazG-like family protein [Urinicoccus massiliensis]